MIEWIETTEGSYNEMLGALPTDFRAGACDALQSERGRQ